MIIWTRLGKLSDHLDNPLIRCERVKRTAYSADHERRVPSDDPGALPRRAAARLWPSGEGSEGDRREARRRNRDASPALHARPGHGDHHQVHLHGDDGHQDHGQPARRAAHH